MFCFHTSYWFFFALSAWAHMTKQGVIEELEHERKKNGANNSEEENNNHFWMDTKTFTRIYFYLLGLWIIITLDYS